MKTSRTMDIGADTSTTDDRLIASLRAVDQRCHRTRKRINAMPGSIRIIATVAVLVAMAAAGTTQGTAAVGAEQPGEETHLQPGMPNVCEYQDVMMVLIRQPCVQAFTRLVKVWKPDCGYTRNWCVGYERRTHYYTTYKERYEPQQVTKYKCCSGWQMNDQGSGCNNSEYGRA
ncbi:unnamed protein product [Lymnaea stagnalis]|uniref:EMI domain-containing protein n=1 Tax=Lymnaea stagnalis TaxID=6523 RepID=A0AAV2HBE6_LYMST